MPDYSIAFLVVGNDFEKIAEKDATYDRSGRFLKRYRVTIYVDVVEGDENIFSSVVADYGSTFHQKFHSVRKVKVPLGGDKGFRWRLFENTQDVYGMFPVKFKITGIRGTELSIQYTTQKRQNQTSSYPFVERGPDTGRVPRLPTAILPEKICFHFEYASTPSLIDGEPSLERLGPMTSFLAGDVGMRELRHFFNENVPDERCTFRIKIRVPEERSSLSGIRNICLNAIKYEDVIDELNLGDGDDENDCLDAELYAYSSNKNVVPGATNKAKHDAINSCLSLEELKMCLNPPSPFPSRPYKFNLFTTEDHTTVEFCFARFVKNIETLESLVRFCVHFVNNSIRLRPPASFKESRTVQEKTNFLFHLIKDPFVERNLTATKTKDKSAISRPTHDMMVDSIATLSLGDISTERLQPVTQDEAFSLDPTLPPMMEIDAFDDNMSCSVFSAASHSESVASHPANNMLEPKVESGWADDEELRSRKRPRGGQAGIKMKLPVEDAPAGSPHHALSTSKPPLHGAASNDRNLPYVTSPRALDPVSFVSPSPPPGDNNPPLVRKIMCKSEDWGDDPNSVLKPFLKKLNARVGNLKTKNLKSLQTYFDARRTELANYVGDNGKPLPRRIGVEVIPDAGKATEDIRMYVVGGQKLVRTRGAAQVPASGGALQLSKMNEQELSEVLSLLGKSSSSEQHLQVAELDHYLGECFGPDPNMVGFALIRVAEEKKKGK